MAGYEKADALAYEKHRNAVDDFEVDWAAALSSGETLSGNPAVTVVELGSDGAVDATSEFGVVSPTTSGSRSQWRFGAASTGAQDEQKQYYVKISQDTSAGRTLISVHRVLVYESADTTAP